MIHLTITLNEQNNMDRIPNDTSLYKYLKIIVATAVRSIATYDYFLTVLEGYSVGINAANYQCMSDTIH